MMKSRWRREAEMNAHRGRELFMCNSGMRSLMIIRVGGAIVSALVVGLISLYVLFQVRPLYKA